MLKEFEGLSFIRWRVEHYKKRLTPYLHRTQRDATRQKKKEGITSHCFLFCPHCMQHGVIVYLKNNCLKNTFVKWASETYQDRITGLKQQNYFWRMSVIRKTKLKDFDVPEYTELINNNTGYLFLKLFWWQSVCVCRWQVFSDAGFQGCMAVLESGEYPCPESWGFTVPAVGSLRALRMVRDDTTHQHHSS